MQGHPILQLNFNQKRNKRNSKEESIDNLMEPKNDFMNGKYNQYYSENHSHPALDKQNYIVPTYPRNEDLAVVDRARKGKFPPGFENHRSNSRTGTSSSSGSSKMDAPDCMVDLMKQIMEVAIETKDTGWVQDCVELCAKLGMNINEDDIDHDLERYRARCEHANQ